MAVSLSTEMYSHHQSIIPGDFFFYYPTKKPVPFSRHFPFLSLASHWQQVIYSLFLSICLFWTFHMDLHSTWPFVSGLLSLSMFPRFIHVTACSSSSLLFLVESCSSLWLWHIVVICSSVDGHQSFRFLTIINNVILNICTQVFTWIYVFFLWDIILAAELLSHMVSLCLAIWEHARLFSKSDCNILHSC